MAWMTSIGVVLEEAGPVAGAMAPGVAGLLPVVALRGLVVSVVSVRDQSVVVHAPIVRAPAARSLGGRVEIDLQIFSTSSPSLGRGRSSGWCRQQRARPAGRPHRRHHHDHHRNTSPAVDNGVNVEALLGAREALTALPRPRSSSSRATNEWVDGTHSRTTVQEFFGPGGEQSHRQPYRSTPTTRRSSPPPTTA